MAHQKGDRLSRALRPATAMVAALCCFLSVAYSQEEHVDALIQKLKGEDRRVGQEAAVALGTAGAPAVEPLIAVLEDKNVDRYARGLAAKALGEIKDPRAVKPLIAVLGEDWRVSESAGDALANIGTPAVGPLIAVLEDKRVDRDARAEAADALGKLGDSRAVQPLILAMNDDDVRYSAAKALANIGTAAVEPSIAVLKDKRLDGHARAEAARTLGKLGDSRAVAPLILLAMDHKDDSGVRVSAVRALEDLKDARAVKPLTTLMRNRNEDYLLRSSAAELLGRIGNPRAVQSLIAALKDKDSQVRRWAAQELRKTKDPRAVRALMAALKSRNLAVVAEVYTFFIEAGEKGTEAVLIEALGKYGNTSMAEAFLNCGNGRLSSAAREWAKREGHIVLPSGGRRGGPTWGSGR